MYEVVFRNGTRKWFDTSYYAVDSQYQSFSGTWYIVIAVERGSVRGEYGIDKGWFYGLREATPEELAEQEKGQADWDALTHEERVQMHIERLAAGFPGLAWGD